MTASQIMFDKVEAFYRPANVSEALRLLQRGKGQARVVAGGTDVVVDGGESVRFLIDITRAGLSYIRRRGTACVIGATTTMAELEASDVIQALAGGLLCKAARTCGSVPIRNMATLGGNMANGSPAADMAPPLLVLDAAVVIADAKGRRKSPLAEYLAGARTPRDARSLLVEVVVPDPPRGKGCRWSFQKLGRTAVDISLVNVAAGLQLDSRGRVKWARIALGSVAPTPMRAAGAEQRMTGRTLDHSLLAEIGAEVAREVRPISDARASAEYRREICSVLVRRALEECSAPAGCLL
jgi:carbon-monoxide dehydrogenase medium subunit